MLRDPDWPKGRLGEVLMFREPIVLTQDESPSLAIVQAQLESYRLKVEAYRAKIEAFSRSAIDWLVNYQHQRRVLAKFRTRAMRKSQRSTDRRLRFEANRAKRRAAQAQRRRSASPNRGT